MTTLVHTDSRNYQASTDRTLVSTGPFDAEFYTYTVSKNPATGVTLGVFSVVYGNFGWYKYMEFPDCQLNYTFHNSSNTFTSPSRLFSNLTDFVCPSEVPPAKFLVLEYGEGRSIVSTNPAGGV